MTNDIQAPDIDKNVLNASPQELVDLFDSYLAFQDKSDSTRSIYTYMLASFLNWLGDIPWYRVHSGDVLRWRDYLLQEYKPLTIATYLTAVRSFYDYMLSAGIMNTNPVVGIRSPRSAPSTTQVITHQDWQALLATCDGDSPIDIRDRAIMVLAYELAMRGSEILNIEISDFEDLHGRRILWVQTRGDLEKGDYMVIPDGVGAVLDAWLAVRGPEPGPLFCGLMGDQSGTQLSRARLYALWGVRKEAAGITDDRITFNSLRHTAIHNRAHHAVEHGKSIYLVQAFARHKSPKATLPYFPEVDKSEDPPELWDYTPEEDHLDG